jgi:Na+/proline symporter
MIEDAGLIWASLLIMAIGNSFHRMGPSFERSRFGFPLMLLGLTCLILFPEDLAVRESELHTSILRSIALIVPFSIGAILILHYSPTYGESRTTGLVSGWLLVVISWFILYSDKSAISLSGTARGMLVLLGVFVSLVVVIIGTYLSESSSGLKHESEPLSNEEEGLVRTILERHLGGDEHGT